MAEVFFANVNYVCNERCVFCAAGLADGPKRSPGRPQGITLDDIDIWLGQAPPSAQDEVMIAGGEPTLHPRLTELVARLASDGARVSLFTNGLRLADPAYAESILDSGVAKILISLFGSRATTHDAVTRRRGSFETTMKALGVLDQLHHTREFELEVRLLVARQCLAENPEIVRMLGRNALRVDRVSLNRLILSAEADAVEAAVTWADARASVNACLTGIRAAGFNAGYEAIPLCVYDGENAAWAHSAALADSPARTMVDGLRYLDPFTATGTAVDSPPPTAIVDAAPCSACDLAQYCGGVEQWYVEAFGTTGLHAVTLGNADAPR